MRHTISFIRPAYGSRRRVCDGLRVNARARVSVKAASTVNSCATKATSGRVLQMPFMELLPVFIRHDGDRSNEV